MRPPSGALQVILARDRWIVGGCLALLSALAWLWLVREAGQMAAPPAAMPNMPDMRGMAGMAMPGMALAEGPQAPGLLTAWFSAFVMWWVMMVAMMLPSASPMILLYAAFTRGAGAQARALAPTALFAASYLVLWALFSVVAAAVQVELARAGLITDASLRLGGARIAGLLLVAAGLYQLTPLKRACLKRCRSPLSFVTQLWRPGWAGAVRLGLTHGIYCIGCCWVLMALLFVGGVMNLAWAAILAVIVLIEKVAPIGEGGVRLVGAAAVIGGVAAMVLGGWGAGHIN